MAKVLRKDDSWPSWTINKQRANEKDNMLETAVEAKMKGLEYVNSLSLAVR